MSSFYTEYQLNMCESRTASQMKVMGILFYCKQKDQKLNIQKTDLAICRTYPKTINKALGKLLN